MSSGIVLSYDIAGISSISSQRVMVAVPLLYLFMTHYAFQLLRLIKGNNEATERLNDLGKRLFMFGIASLFSLNFLQNTVFGTILSWLILFSLIVAHCLVFIKETNQKYHNYALLLYYTVLMLWFAINLGMYVYNGIS